MEPQNKTETTDHLLAVKNFSKSVSASITDGSTELNVVACTEDCADDLIVCPTVTTPATLQIPGHTCATNLLSLSGALKEEEYNEGTDIEKFLLSQALERSP